MKAQSVLQESSCESGRGSKLWVLVKSLRAFPDFLDAPSNKLGL